MHMELRDPWGWHCSDSTGAFAAAGRGTGAAGAAPASQPGLSIRARGRRARRCARFQLLCSHASSPHFAGSSSAMRPAACTLLASALEVHGRMWGYVSSLKRLVCARVSTGGSVTTVYYNALGLRALLKPAWFARKGRALPRPARAPPRLAPRFNRLGSLPPDMTLTSAASRPEVAAPVQ